MGGVGAMLMSDISCLPIVERSYPKRKTEARLSCAASGTIPRLARSSPVHCEIDA
jgi:hypothetical protein